MNTVPRIYVACLASYNNGRLHGRWINADTDVNVMQSLVDKMLATSPYPNVTRAIFQSDDGMGDLKCVTMDSHGKFNPGDGWNMIVKPFPSAEEYAIHDHEGLGDLGEYAGLQEVARRVALIDLADEKDVPTSIMLQFADDHAHGVTFGGDPKDYAADIESAWDDSFSQRFNTGEEANWAAEYCEEIGYEIPDWLQGHVDWKSVARDMLMDYSTIDCDGETFLFHN